jgi:poly(3-hydroxybutyrate) depolymerase
MQFLYENSGLYSFIEMAKNNLEPMRQLMKAGESYYNNDANPASQTSVGKYIGAICEVTERVTRSYAKPEFAIDSVTIEGEKVEVKEELVLHKSFCNLIHFKKKYKTPQPKLLIAAPLAGHHASLLRDTIRSMLISYDVYVTDWIDAKQVPVSEGEFDMDDFILYIIEFINHLGSHVHVLAVCQPTVPVLAAVALMSEDDSPNVPKSMILMGGPVDVRKSPTEVDIFAAKKSMHWFESNVITRVPINYPGFMRPVYPGFIQLSGFMSMHPGRHIGEHMKLFYELMVGDDTDAEAMKKFYDEYLAVLDMPAEFYLQTIRVVFKEQLLARGKLVSRGRKVNLSAISKCALLSIEGEFDDIAGIGQTKAALDLCKNITDAHKEYYMQKGVGHYGVFSGRRFREQITPVINEFVAKRS